MFSTADPNPLLKDSVARRPESAWGHPGSYVAAESVRAHALWHVYTDLGRVIHRVAT